MTIQYEALVNDLKARGIHSILTQFCDLHGVAKGKLVPLANLKEWVEQGAGFAGPSIWGTGLGRFGARSEYYGRVQVETLRELPFLPGVAHAVCDGYAGGQALSTCSRQLLKRQLERLSQRGWKLRVGIEPEFFLLRQDAQGRWLAADDQDQLDKPSYDLKAIARQFAFLEDMRSQLSALGFELQQMDHEDACGQYEINYKFDEALAAADRFMLFKVTAHAVAEKHGAVFSCMPKPFANAPGSGLHFHMSLTDAQGRAVFHSVDDALQWSPAAYQFVAGLLSHADALSALCAPTVNSYKRLACSDSASGTTWAPVWKAYGDNNRTCLVRSVAGRLEWRLPDPSCNVYVALAATLAAGLDGIENQLQAPPACAEDLYERFAKGQVMPGRLPSDLGRALESLAQDQVLQQSLGVEFCDQRQQFGLGRGSDYSQTVSAWEFERYARLY